jgi:putative redox protein
MMVTVPLEGGMRFTAHGESGHAVVMDASPKGGGADSASHPIEVLLSALGGCTGMDVVSILRKIKTEPSAFRIEIDGERASELPKRFTKIHWTYVVAGDVPEANLQRAIDLSLEKYCPVASTRTGIAEITSEYRIESS